MLSAETLAHIRALVDTAPELTDEQGALVERVLRATPAAPAADQPRADAA